MDYNIANFNIFNNTFRSYRTTLAYYFHNEGYEGLSTIGYNYCIFDLITTTKCSDE